MYTKCIILSAVGRIHKYVKLCYSSRFDCSRVGEPTIGSRLAYNMANHRIASGWVALHPHGSLGNAGEGNQTKPQTKAYPHADAPRMI